MEWLRSLLLGVVQGVTEFLPVSSDGHLSLLQILTAGPDGQGAEAGKENLFFNVMLHLGTAAAIVVHYGKQVRAGARGFLGSTDVPENYRRDRLIRLRLLVVVATSPLIPYVKLKPLNEAISGNGKPGLKVQVAKLETAMKVVAIVGTSGLGIALTLLFK